MKTLTTLLLILGLLIAPCAMAGDEAASADAQTLEGEYIWKRQDKDISGALKAVFEPTGESTWNVAFYFQFEDEDHIYKGTAEGSLTDGELKGDVMTDGDEPRPFYFSGEFVDGNFNGTHWGMRDNGDRADTGTMSLASAGD
ncbi:MAG: hypothetical protein AAGE94_17870 [Acidobacteriota bacterium]